MSKSIKVLIAMSMLALVFTKPASALEIGLEFSNGEKYTYDWQKWVYVPNLVSDFNYRMLQQGTPNIKPPHNRLVNFYEFDRLYNVKTWWYFRSPYRINNGKPGDGAKYSHRLHPRSLMRVERDHTLKWARVCFPEFCFGALKNFHLHHPFTIIRFTARYKASSCTPRYQPARVGAPITYNSVCRHLKHVYLNGTRME